MPAFATAAALPTPQSEKHALTALPPVRLFNVFAGAVLLLAAVGLWAMPGSLWDSGLMLFKLMISIALLVSGLALIAPTRAQTPEVQLDPRAERLEVVMRNEFGRIVRSETYAYSDLSEVDVRNGAFVARDHQGRTVVELPLIQPVEELETLRTALGPSFSRTI